MSNGTSSGSGGAGSATAPAPTTSTLAFALVVIMLSFLFALIAGLLIVAGWYSDNDKLLDYSKWALSVLVGAFGAWIGAGAAYFFGRESLSESSRSTEAVLRIQQAALRGAATVERIGDLALTAMNTEFMFKTTATKQEIITALTQYVDYWWVPVLDKDGKGILEDLVHARVFWDPAIVATDSVAKIMSDIDTTPSLKTALGALHGASFFVRAALNDSIADVTETMKKSGAVVGVVVDEKGKPTYCFTRQNLLTAQKRPAA